MCAQLSASSLRRLGALSFKRRELLNDKSFDGGYTQGEDDLCAGDWETKKMQSEDGLNGASCEILKDTSTDSLLCVWV